MPPSRPASTPWHAEEKDAHAEQSTGRSSAEQGTVTLAAGAAGFPAQFGAGNEGFTSCDENRMRHPRQTSTGNSNSSDSTYCPPRVCPKNRTNVRIRCTSPMAGGATLCTVSRSMVVTPGNAAYPGIPPEARAITAEAKPVNEVS